MGMRGPAPKLTHLRVISGTDKPCKVRNPTVDFGVLTEVPGPPDWLPNPAAVAEWIRLAPLLVRNRILTDAGLMALGHLCALHGKIVQLWDAGETPTGNMIAQYRSLTNDFGLTPAAAQRGTVGGGEAKKNPFEKFKPPTA